VVAPKYTPVYAMGPYWLFVYQVGVRSRPRFNGSKSVSFFFLSAVEWFSRVFDSRFIITQFPKTNNEQCFNL